MLSVTDAVNAASSHLKKLFPSAEKMLLEEVELSDDDQFWLITLSFFDPTYDASIGSMTSIANMLGSPRLYRIVKLNGSTGEVRSVKIRERQYA